MTTPSLRAVRLYSEADDLIAQGRSDLAEPLLRDAIAEDPDFASAHMHLAWALRNQGRPPEEYRVPAEVAYQLRDTTSDRERYFLLGSYHSFFDRISDAVTNYEALLRLYPDHFWATNNLYFLYLRQNRSEEAIPLLLARAELRPYDFHSNALAAHQVFQTGGDISLTRAPLDRALRILRDAPDVEAAEWMRPWAAVAPAYTHWLLGDAGAALNIVASVAASVSSRMGSDRTGMAWYVGGAYAMLGAFDDAERMLHFVDNDWLRERELKTIAWARGKSPATGFHGPSPRAFVNETPPTSLLGRNLLQASVAVDGGDWGAAISLLEEGFENTEQYGPVLNLYALSLLARACYEAGEHGRALSLLNEGSPLHTRLFVSSGYRAIDWLWLEAERSRLARELGHEELAMQVESRLWQLLAVADEDHPILLHLTAQPRRQPSREQPVPSAN